MAFLVISTAPKSVFHDLVTDHQDSAACNEPFQSTKHLHKATYQCHFDDLVVSIPYIFFNAELALATPVNYLERNTGDHLSALAWRHQSTASRGPPQV